MRDAQAAREHAIQDERESTAAEIQRLHIERDDALRDGRNQTNKFENELATLRSALERESSARASVETRHTELLLAMEDKEQKLQVALAEATTKTKEAEVVSRELDHARAEAEEHHRIQALNNERLTSLLSEQAETLRKLEEARARGEDLEDQIKFARAEGDEAFRALNEATREKDRLRTQSLEADRVLRDHIAEADGDRAVLEHQFSELQAAHETTERELKEALSDLDICKADLVGTREELQRTQHELSDSESMNAALREEVVRARVKHDDLTRKLAAADRTLNDMLDVAVAFRDTNVRLLSATQKSLSHAARLSSKHAASMMASTFDAVYDHSQSAEALAAYTTPIDWSDPLASLQILRRFDLDAYSETVLKAVTTIRKWQKQCKEYRDRARGKISFRNFAKGDLALFLPTRNSVAKPWAAFNGTQAQTILLIRSDVSCVVSFPHYFLTPSPQITAQLENREWIVARITSITERVVDHRVRWFLFCELSRRAEAILIGTELESLWVCSNVFI
jgi:autophagy-related protein 11